MKKAQLALASCSFATDVSASPADDLTVTKNDREWRRVHFAIAHHGTCHCAAHCEAGFA